MDFAPPRPRRTRGENIVPMINVVFLLLIFFLMSAQIAPPDPFDVSLPESAAEGDARAPDALYVAADGTLAFGGAEGTQALVALQARHHTEALFIRADAALPAMQLAQLLTQLGTLGVTDVYLVTGGRDASR